MKTDDSQPLPAASWPARRASWLAIQIPSTASQDPPAPKPFAKGPAPDRDSHPQDLMPPPEPAWPRIFPGL